MFSSTRALCVILVSGIGIISCGNPPLDKAVGTPKAPKPSPEIVSAQEAVQSPDIPTIDPMTLDDAEVDKVLAKTPRCSFSYTAASQPVFVMGTNADSVAGVIKLHGKLVKLSGSEISSDNLPNGGIFIAEPITITIEPLQKEVKTSQNEQNVQAEMHFELRQGLKVGYEGWIKCTKEKHE